jgi:hypothetical protein
MAAFVASCDTLGNRHAHGWNSAKGHGPRAHAPAHGYRRQHIDGYDMIYDTDYGVWVLVGLPDCYYHNDRYYRLHGDLWQISIRADGEWRQISHRMVPRSLRNRARIRVTAGAVPTAQVSLSTQGKARGHAKNK